MVCPYLLDGNRCHVAQELGQVAVRTAAASCEACQQNDNPRAINVVTIGMAMVARKRLGQSSDSLKQMLKNYLPDSQPPPTLRIAAYRPGPGSDLKKRLAWFAKPSESCNCETRAETMNDWGAEGCRQNIDTIVDWLLEEAELRGLPNGKFTRLVAKSLVTTAIRRFERKFPGGISDPDDDDQAAE